MGSFQDRLAAKVAQRRPGNPVSRGPAVSSFSGEDMAFAAGGGDPVQPSPGKSPGHHQAIAEARQSSANDLIQQDAAAVAAGIEPAATATPAKPAEDNYPL